MLYDIGLTLNTIEPQIHPLIGGIQSEQSLSTLNSASLSLASHHDAMILAPLDSSSLINAFATSSFAPERESSMRLRAFRLNIQRAVVRPRPPRPPEMT